MPYNLIPINRPDVDLADILSFYFPMISVERLEKHFARWLGTDSECVMTTSGKMAIYMLFKSLKLKGNVVTTPLTCSMALKPIIANDHELKFADINPDTFNIDIASLEKAIDHKTAAIYLVHLGGMPNEMDAIMDIAKSKNILVIEDCAQSLGSEYKGIKSGCFGDYSLFSFSKNIWLAGGGMIVGNNKDVVNNIREYQNKLNEPPKGLLKYRMKRDLIEAGRGNVFFNYLYFKKFLENNHNANIGVDISSYFQSQGVANRPSSRQASVIYNQFKTIDKKNKRRNEISDYYSSKINLKKFTIQKKMEGVHSIYSKYYVTIKNGNNKNYLKKLMNEGGIDAKQLTKSHGLYLQPRFDEDVLFKEYETIYNCNSYLDIHDRIVALPISSNMKKREIDYVINQVNGV